MIFFPSNFNYTFKFIHLKWFFKFNTKKNPRSVYIFKVKHRLYTLPGIWYSIQFFFSFMSFNCWKTSGNCILNNITTILQNIYRQANKTNSKAFYNMALSQTYASKLVWMSVLYWLMQRSAINMTTQLWNHFFFRY